MKEFTITNESIFSGKSQIKKLISNDIENSRKVLLLGRSDIADSMIYLYGGEKYKTIEYCRLNGRVTSIFKSLNVNDLKSIIDAARESNISKVYIFPDNADLYKNNKELFADSKITFYIITSQI